MGTYVRPEDFDAALPTVSSTRLGEVIADAEAVATLMAPGLKAEAFLADAERMAAAKAILRAAVIYQCEPALDGDKPRSQIDALKALTRGPVALTGVYTLTLGNPDTLPRR